MIRREIDGANRNALTEKMDLGNVIREIAALGGRVGAANGPKALENVLFQDADLQFNIRRHGVAYEIVVGLIEYAEDRIIGYHVPQPERAGGICIGAEHPVGANAVPKDGETIGGESAQPEVHDAIGNAVHGGRLRSQEFTADIGRRVVVVIGLEAVKRAN